MAATKTRTRATRRGAARHIVRRTRSWPKIALWSLAAVGALVAAVLLIRLASPSSTVDASVQAVAVGNAGGSVEALTGTQHTVYHSAVPLPDESRPPADGKPTLVWFSGTWCEFCERMEPYAHDVMSRYREQAVFVEKSVDDDRSAAARYGIRGTPTFVLINASGREITRFGFQASANEFAATIEQALRLVDA